MAVFAMGPGSGGGNMETVTGTIPAVNDGVFYYTNGSGEFVSEPMSARTTVSVLKNTAAYFTADDAGRLQFTGSTKSPQNASTSTGDLRLAVVTGDFAIQQVK